MTLFKKYREAVISFICGIGLITVLIIIWEIAAARGWEYAKIFPPPSRFLKQLSDDGFKIGLGSQAASIQASIISSILRVLVGLFLGLSTAFLFGFFVQSNIWLKRFLMPLVRVLAPVAPVAWIPMALVLFGIGNQTAVFIVFMGVFFTLSIAVVRAIEIVPDNLINSAKTLGATKFQIWYKVVFPSILPNVFTILRLNFIAAWMAVLAAEMTGLQDGLGAIIMTGRNLFNNEMILMGMLLIGVVGFLFDSILKYIQDKFLWWDKKS
jgi:NitT/TauT family transport system permease protein